MTKGIAYEAYFRRHFRSEKKENITDKVLNKRKKAYFMGEKDYLIILNEIS